MTYERLGQAVGSMVTLARDISVAPRSSVPGVFTGAMRNLKAGQRFRLLSIIRRDPGMLTVALPDNWRIDLGSNTYADIEETNFIESGKGPPSSIQPPGGVIPPSTWVSGVPKPLATPNWLPTAAIGVLVGVGLLLGAMVLLNRKV